MKQKFSSLLLTAMLCLAGANAWALSDVEGVYQIGTAQDLADFAALVNGGTSDAKAALTANINMSGETWTGISGYTGTFDGKDYTISNLAGPLFISTSTNVVIQNLTLEGAINNGDGEGTYAAFVVDHNGGLFTMSNCVNKTTVTAISSSNVGGFVGNLTLTESTFKITSCKNMAAISGKSSVGGFVGYYSRNADSGSESKFIDCGNEGNITGSGPNVGGLSGYGYQGKVSYNNSYNKGTVVAKGEGEEGYYAGGIEGVHRRYWVIFDYCYNQGSVSGDSYVGGLAGRASTYNSSQYVTVTNSYNTGDIACTTKYVGGLVGQVRAGGHTAPLNHNYNTGKITGPQAAGIFGEVTYTGNIDLCYNTGNIETTYEGRSLVGWTKNTSVLTNCWNIGEITTTDASTFDNTLVRNAGSVTNCYELANASMNPTYELPTGYEAAWLSDGHFCYFLNGDQSDIVWYQTIGKDNYPVLSNKSKKVLKAQDVYTNINMESVPYDEGYYLLGTPAQYETYTKFVNAGGGALNTNAKLTADLDFSDDAEMETLGYAGGNADGTTYDANSKLFGGIFDGQGHTITVGRAAAPALWAPIAGISSTGVVRNLRVAGTITGDKGYYAGIVYTVRGGLVENCMSSVTIDATAGGSNNKGLGGIARMAYGDAKFTRCVFDGELVNTSWSNGITVSQEAIAEISECLVLDFGATASTNKTFYRTGSNPKKFSDCYYLNTIGVKNQGTAITEEALQSGIYCYMLNGGNTDNPVFRQTIGGGITFGTGDIVYKVGDYQCDGVTPKGGGEAVYTNTPGTLTIDPHNYVNGFCSVCGAPDMTFVPQVADVFQISTPDQLNWFAGYVNYGVHDAKAALTADIDMNGVNYIPIGLFRSGGDTDIKELGLPSVNHAFVGSFDGQGHVIKNLTVDDAAIDGMGYYECGLFSRMNGAVVQNLGIENITIITPRPDGRAGILVGWMGVPTVKNVYAVGDINITAAGAPVSKKCFVPSCWSPREVYNCWSVCDAIYTSRNTSGDPHNCFVGEQVEGKLTTGEICYEINAGAGETIFYQAIGTDQYPTFTSGDSRKVYKTSTAGWGTFFDPAAAYKFPGVKAYTGKINGDWLKLTEVSQANAGTPVILEGGYYNKVAADTPAEMPESDLQGTTAELTADGTQYILAKPAEGEIGFYPATADTKIPAGKAYLTIAGGGVKAIYFGEPTGIEKVQELNGSNAQDVIFDLSGRRVEKAVKGIYIVNGKKVLK